MDSLAACMFVFLGQGLEQYFAQAAALPNMVLFRVTALSLSLIPMIRLVLRPMPDPKSPFEGKGMSAIELFRATCRLNILWAVAYCGTVALGTTWRYVEEANYATAEAVHEELRRLREAERV